jgi:hypothetical protein
MILPVSLHIRRLCVLVRAVGVLLLASVLVLYLGTWAFPDAGLWNQHWAAMARIGGLPPNAGSGLAPVDRFIVGAVSVPYLICLVWAFRHLELMLRGFERAEFFDRATVRHLRAFAALLLVAKALGMVAVHVRVGMLASLATPGQRRFVFNVSSDELAVIVLCALIFLIAHMMDEGRNLAEENRSFL